MADIAIIEPVQSGSAPLTYNLADRQPLEVLAVHADYDGSGAGGDFKPAVSFYAPDGKKLGTFTADTVTAGSSSSVTWFPFAPPSSGGGTDPNAVHFDTSPQNASFLETDTTNGVTISDKGNAFTSGITLESGNGSGGGGQINLTTDDGLVFVGSTDIVDRIGTSGSYQLQNHGGTVILEADGGASVRLTFNGSNLISHNLPTVDPAVSGALWNNAGVVTVSP